MQRQPEALTPRLPVPEASKIAPEVKTPEEGLFSRLGSAVGELVHDVREANDRAKKKLEETATSRVMRGVLTGFIGGGLELVTDQMFDKAWRGEGAIWERFVMSPDTGRRLARYAQKHPRMAHFIKESTQGIGIAALYNFFAFRSGQIFDQVGSENVLRSIYANAFEAALVPSIPDEMKKTARELTQPPYTVKTYTTKYPQRRRGRFGYKQQSGTYLSADQMMSQWNAYNKGKDVDYVTQTMYEKRYRQPGGAMPERDGVVGTLFNFANPVTDMAVKMVWEGVTTFAQNYGDIQKAKKLNKWSGGKAQAAQKGENVFFGSSKHKPTFRREKYDERFED